MVHVRLIANLKTDALAAQRVGHALGFRGAIFRRSVAQVEPIDNAPSYSLDKVVEVADRERSENRRHLGGSASVGANRSRCMVFGGLGVSGTPGGVLRGVAADAQHALRAQPPDQGNELLIVLGEEFRMAELRGLVTEAGKIQRHGGKRLLWIDREAKRSGGLRPQQSWASCQCAEGRGTGKKRATRGQEKTPGRARAYVVK